MEIANHSLEMEKRQIAIPSSSERDKDTFPKDTPRSESPACKPAYNVGEDPDFDVASSGEEWQPASRPRSSNQDVCSASTNSTPQTPTPPFG
ncbi:hypothetical protein G5714_021419 [Onychostoma macrolepis]|uniref:Uncharacterized protein n=1 Tax=Onychostoma macrolepis TaxID=369639 RepID=A0A7J6BRQ0_9TELE|nr:hypothetical protein G5714_021419 [Onychostoma macrolepis]